MSTRDHGEPLPYQPHSGNAQIIQSLKQGNEIARDLGQGYAAIATEMVDELVAALALPQVKGEPGEVETLRKERDVAQSMCTAWQEVYEAIEAHIRDRMAMDDPASPSVYLSIIESDVRDVKAGSAQIVASRWSDYKRLTARAETAESKLADARVALEPFATQYVGAGNFPEDTRTLLSLKIGDLRTARDTYTRLSAQESAQS